MKKTHDISTVLVPGKMRAQFHLLDEAARQILCGTFGRKQPADRLLAVYFKANRRCGSRDRALISESIYALLRFWGFLRRFLPESRRADVESGAIRLTEAELGALLMAGRFIAGDGMNLDGFLSVWKLPELPVPAAETLQRAQQLAEYFHAGVQLAAADLIPAWVQEMLPADLECGGFLSALAERPPMWLRLQTQSEEERSAVMAELCDSGAKVTEHPGRHDALCVRAKINLFTLAGFREGKFELQDLASQCVGAACDAKPGERWLDGCAGAGGKTLQLAQMMQRKGNITATDLRSYKLEDLRRRARRAGFPNITPRPLSPALRKPKHPYDGVLVDAPCSCSGVWRRNPGAQWKLTADEIAELSRQQLEILESYAGAVRTGGVLVYATCSLFDKENSGVVLAFLERHNEYKLDPFPHPLTGNIVPGMVRIDGAAHQCDTLFVSRMRKVQ